jgi:acyl-CoA thioesterase
MSFQSMVTEAAESPNVNIEEGWGQGRATYGGLVAALGLARMESIAELGDHRLRSLSVTFVGPVAPGETTLKTKLLRHGNNVTHTSCELTQEGRVQATLQASFGSARPSSLAIDRGPAPDLRPVDECDEIPVVPGITPDFFAHFQLHPSEGGMPFSGGEPDFAGWMRFRDELDTFTDLHLVALIDAWPPSVMPAMTAPAPGSSLTWSLGLTPFEQPREPNSYWGYRVRTQQAAEGYAFSTAHIWTESGHLAAVSQQSLAIFA